MPPETCRLTRSRVHGSRRGGAGQRGSEQADVSIAIETGAQAPACIFLCRGMAARAVPAEAAPVVRVNVCEFSKQQRDTMRELLRQATIVVQSMSNDRLWILEGAEPATLRAAYAAAQGCVQHDWSVILQDGSARTGATTGALG